MSEKITVFSVDNHPLLRDGLAAVINAQPDMRLIGQASTGGEAIRALRKQKTDVIVMDDTLPDMSGIDAMIAIQGEFPDARCIIFSTFGYENDIRRALAAGAQAYILKSMPPRELVDVIRQVHAGNKKISVQIAAELAEHYGDEPLSCREVEVLRHVADGNRNRDIANKLFITEETVKAHMKHIFGKLGAIDRTQALVIALRRGLVQL
ncbi:MAG TPA: response regulator transcription factor [Terriglobales bacterium]|jgi:DNA-binding NarL/FixJ family response regulator|nr:response regulator transcription factor [Terriglobales bacterium]